MKKRQTYWTVRDGIEEIGYSFAVDAVDAAGAADVVDAVGAADVVDAAVDGAGDAVVDVVVDVVDVVALIDIETVDTETTIAVVIVKDTLQARHKWS